MSDDIIYTLTGTIEVTVDMKGMPKLRSVHVDPGALSEVLDKDIVSEITSGAMDKMVTVSRKVVREIIKKWKS